MARTWTNILRTSRTPSRTTSRTTRSPPRGRGSVLLLNVLLNLLLKTNLLLNHALLDVLRTAPISRRITTSYAGIMNTSATWRS